MDLDVLFGAPGRVGVDRAIAEFRAGRPVLIGADSGCVVLAQPLDSLDEPRLASLREVARGEPPKIAITARRADWIGLPNDDRNAVAVLLAPTDCANAVIEIVAGDHAGMVDPSAPIARTGCPACGANGFGNAAIELARLAHMLPAAILVEPAADQVGAISRLAVTVSIAAIDAYRHEAAGTLEIVSEARVPMLPGIDTRFVVFRGGVGRRDQIAVVFGQPDPSEPVRIRLHSACLSGDLFGSLKCDCGDQLRMTVEYFHAAGGGVLLYLDQEGRGIGIANKIRAYDLQDHGSDTIDADHQLGFGVDDRSYEEAARMLAELGYTRVLVHTNNPRKSEGLGRHGIEVVGREPVSAPVNAENAGYLRTKALRAGHFIDLARFSAQMNALSAGPMATPAAD